MKFFVGILIAICIFFASQNKLAGAEPSVTCKDIATGDVRVFDTWCPVGWQPTRPSTRVARTPSL